MMFGYGSVIMHDWLMVDFCCSFLPSLIFILLRFASFSSLMYVCVGGGLDGTGINQIHFTSLGYSFFVYTTVLLLLRYYCS